ncbi:MAG: ribonuclease P protein component [Clostridia bacterium]|nr:ribonuclease P protein component [Clostridia bacterium]MBQ3057385.1 ribonuclease P protein component [Clostridia bacterium]
MMRIIKLKENRDFRRAYNRGKAYVTPFAVVYVNKNRTGDIRLGITAGKKIGKAVQRNRAKRVITAAFRSVMPKIRDGLDFVIVARTRILNVKSTELALIFEKTLKTAGALKNENEENTNISR